MTHELVASLAVVAALSFLLSPRVRTVEGFFRGCDDAGTPPGLWTLVLSQVTTWIFARSLLNAAILGYYYGIAGALAYAAYYLSFITGGIIVDRVRFGHGHASIQDFLRDNFGSFGSRSYNVLVAVRLLSEVFANLLVVGIVFGTAGSNAYTVGIIAVAGLTLGYSMIGGLRASLRTDIFQSLLVLTILAALVVMILGSGGFSFTAVFASSPDPQGPGWVLLAVAALQIWSYPVHDPVMMDRGFLADRETTRRSFRYAAWISIIAILAFGLIGVHAGLARFEGEQLVSTLSRLLGNPTMMVFNLVLVLSAISTLDSTFSSAAKLTVVDMGAMATTATNGRKAMAVFMIGGLVFLFLGSKDLFAAVAVSGTASMFLAPVVVFCVFGRRRVATWAYVVAFTAAMAGGALYMLEAGGHLSLIGPAFDISHKYTKLLIICIGVLGIGFGSFAMGLRQTVKEPAAN